MNAGTGESQGNSDKVQKCTDPQIQKTKGRDRNTKKGIKRWSCLRQEGGEVRKAQCYNAKGKEHRVSKASTANPN